MMDNPVPEGVTVHYIPFDFMGSLVPLPGYKIGDWINYGGWLYFPRESGSLYLVCEATRPSSKQVFYHKAEVWGSREEGFSFYCYR